MIKYLKGVSGAVEGIVPVEEHDKIMANGTSLLLSSD